MDQSLSHLYYSIRPSTVMVKVYVRRGPSSPYVVGGGAIVAKEGYVLTSSELISGASAHGNPISCTMSSDTGHTGGGNEYEARVLYTDDRCPLALLKISVPGDQDLQVVNFPQDTYNVRAGARAVTIVHDGRCCFSFRMGDISYEIRYVRELNGIPGLTSRFPYLTENLDDDVGLMEMSNLRAGLGKLNAQGSPVFNREGRMIGLWHCALPHLDYAVGWKDCREFVDRCMGKLRGESSEESSSTCTTTTHSAGERAG